MQKNITEWTNVRYTVPDYRLTNEERETHIYFNEADGTATLETFNKAMIRKLDEYAAADDRIHCAKAEKHNGFDDLVLKEYVFPKGWVRVQKPPTLTEEQRKAKVESVRLARQNLKK